MHQDVFQGLLQASLVQDGGGMETASLNWVKTTTEHLQRSFSGWSPWKCVLQRCTGLALGCSLYSHTLSQVQTFVMIWVKMQQNRMWKEHQFATQTHSSQEKSSSLS